MSWIVVGLGNPGAEYRGTRHNVGFEVLEILAEMHQIRLARAKHRALLGRGRIAGEFVTLLKPLSYMNLSGQPVSAAARESGVPPSRVLVVTDDLDLPIGRLRLKAKGSSGGHNGHKSLIAALGTQEYPRLRIGIGRPGEDHAVDHVLGPFTHDERPAMNQALRAAATACEQVVAGRWEEALATVTSHNSTISSA